MPAMSMLYLSGSAAWVIGAQARQILRRVSDVIRDEIERERRAEPAVARFRQDRSSDRSSSILPLR